MNKTLKGLIAASIAIVVSPFANAELQGRLEKTPGTGDYQAYYDTSTNLSWLTDANYAYTTGYVEGRSLNIQHADALIWANNLSVEGVTGWRLPKTVQPDVSCSYQNSNGGHGPDCTGSEFGHLFYNTLGNTKSYSVSGGELNSGPFLNFEIMHGHFWTEDELEANTLFAWWFSFANGYQLWEYKTKYKTAWAVHDGDVGDWGVDPLVKDFDEDGIPDLWELNGIDVDNDGTIDFDLPAMGADPCRKTIAIEIDYMDGSITGLTHKPHPDLIATLADAYDKAPIPAAVDCPFAGFPTKPSGVNFVGIIDDEVPEEEGEFIPTVQLAAARAKYFDERLLPWLYYALYIHEKGIPDSGNVIGTCCDNGSVQISLGNMELKSVINPDIKVPFFDSDSDPYKKLYFEASTLMHELGHALGLGHGGDNNINYKPNYLSIMNYNIGIFGLTDFNDPDTPILDYSRRTLMTLDERSLDEQQPLCADPDCPALLSIWYKEGNKYWGPSNEPRNWNIFAGIESSPVSVDLNNTNEVICVGDGADDILNTTPEGDDTIQPYKESETQTIIDGGADGICDTTKAAGSDDSQINIVGSSPNVKYDGHNDWAAVKFRAFEGANGNSSSNFEVSNSEEITVAQASELDTFWEQVRSDIKSGNLNHPPIISIPGNVIVDSNLPAGWAGNLEVVSGVTASDPDGDILTLTSNAADILPIGINIITWYATDSVGATAEATQSVEVIGLDTDSIPPELSLPVNQEAEATSTNGAIVDFIATANDLVDGEVTTNCTPASASMFPIGSTDVSCSAEDASGNAVSGSFSVAVVDTTAPVLTVPANTSAQAIGLNGATVSYAAAATDLVDPNVTISCTPVSGSLFALGSTQVDCTATDASLNQSSASFMVSVVDTTAPVINVPADIIAEATELGGATVSYAATATDLVDPNVTVSCVPTSGSLFALGSTQVDCTATDASLNQSNASFMVSVADTTAPVINVPADISVNTETEQTVVDLGLATASDVFGVVISNNAPSNFPVGVTTVTWIAEDANGNLSSATQVVTVTMNMDSGYEFSGFQAPISSGGVYKRGRVLPIKFQLFASDGSPVLNESAELSIYQLSDNVVTGQALDTQSNSNADSGNSFRLTEDGYIYNLGTKSMDKGTYRLVITLSDNSSYHVDIALK